VTSPSRRPHNPLIELGVTIIAPALILMKLSGDAHLGRVGALLLALALPLGWGLWDAFSRRKFNFIAALGVLSTLLTGGIGLMKLDASWLAVKEATVPGVIGLAVLASTWMRQPLIRVLVFNPAIFDVDRIEAALAQRGTRQPFDARLRQGTLLLASTFFFSSAANYVLARWIVVSAAGTEAFNEELGRLTLLSYPVIALPSMVMMAALLWWLASQARQLTGLTLDDMWAAAHRKG
jgi:hypothetical protein